MIYINESMQGKLDNVINRLGSLPPLPESIQHINTMIDSRNTTLDAVGHEIATDYALSAQVLKLINSSLYGLKNPISSIKQAVVLLGLGVIRTLVGTSWVANLIKESSKGLHHHALATARTSFILSRTLSIGDPEEIASIGLLHDVGKAALAKFAPEEFHAICREAAAKGSCFHEAEQQILGVTHAHVGGHLLERWNLPARIVVPVLHHHNDAGLPEEHRTETALLRLADTMVRAEGCGYTGDMSIPDFPEEIATELDITPNDLRELSNITYDEMCRIPRYIGERAL